MVFEKKKKKKVFGKFFGENFLISLKKKVKEPSCVENQCVKVEAGKQRGEMR